jgi:hypothetical protein
VDLEVTLVPQRAAVEVLVRQVRQTGRAYPLFRIAQLLLNHPERLEAHFRATKKTEGQPSQALWLCSLDESVWLSDKEAVAHMLRKHFDTFYQTERLACDPPRGTYTFVAQCGMSGVVLGPPNYHDYQPKLCRLHAERFAGVPFETYKARIKMVRDEATVKQWIEQQSFKAEYVCLNVPEPKRLATREEAEQHFREVHASNLIRQVDAYVLPNVGNRRPLCDPMQSLLRSALDDQRRFPLRLVNTMSHEFGKDNLHFFKAHQNVTYVCVAKPRYLDVVATPVSDGICRILDFIKTHPRRTRIDLLKALAPEQQAASTEQPAAPAEPSNTSQPAQEGAPSSATAAEAPAKPAPTPAEPSPQLRSVIADLHWLIHQGNVIEYATDGTLEIPRPPQPKPVKPAPKAPTAAATPVAEPSAAGDTPQTSASSAAQSPVTAEPNHETTAAAAPAEEITSATNGNETEPGTGLALTAEASSAAAVPAGSSQEAPAAPPPSASVPRSE